MKLLSIACTSFLLLLLAPRSAAQTELKDLAQVNIVVEDLNKTAQDIGLSMEILESQALVGLKRDLPKLMVSKTANSFVYLSVMAVEIGHGEVTVYVHIDVRRPVKILRDWSDSEVTKTLATVWDRSGLVTGPKVNVPSRVRQVISDITTELAADYYRQNAK